MIKILSHGTQIGGKGVAPVRTASEAASKVLDLVSDAETWKLTIKVADTRQFPGENLPLPHDRIPRKLSNEETFGFHVYSQALGKSVEKSGLHYGVSRWSSLRMSTEQLGFIRDMITAIDTIAPIMDIDVVIFSGFKKRYVCDPQCNGTCTITM